jgi:dipeptidyl-peptidase-4
MKKNFTTFMLFLLVAGVFAQETTELTLNDIWSSRKFYPKSVRGVNPMNDGKYFSTLENDSINIYEYRSGDYIRTIAKAADMIPEGDTTNIRISSYSFSNDEKKILIPTKTRAIYRRSSESYFYIWDLEKKELAELSGGGKQRLADFSPDGTKVAFVRDNNIFIKDLRNNEEKQITDDGKINEIINGTTDWVYEEEFAVSKGFHWSPDGRRIAFMRFDESDVKEWQMTTWGDLYPEHYKFKYPKAGEDNSIVSIHVYDMISGETRTMDVGEETDQYLPRIQWTKDPQKLAIFRVNRLQNNFQMLLANVVTGNSEVIYSEENKYYIEESHYDHVIFIDEEQYLMTSEKDGYYHIYLNNINGGESTRLTSGNWDVTDIFGYDEEKKSLYFQAATQTPYNRELWLVNLKGNMSRINVQTGWDNPEFSADYKYYVNSFSTINVPPVYTVNRINGRPVRTLENNKKLRETIENYNFSEADFFSFTTSDSVELYGYKILPPDFNPNKKYPVFMYVYGGPGAQTVTNRWNYYNYLWFQMLAQKGYIVVSVDNRGTGARGEEFKKMTYLELGKYETVDQIEAAKYLASLDYVDPERIGIFGWSYGGYMSTLCLTKGADHFKMAIAVAPVTNWRYYDNIYTERFMRKPQDNPDGYDDNSPINHVEKMKGKYLLVHGTGDDNVHVQNSMDLITALVNANKQFDLMLYPNKNHGIYGGNTRYHLYKKMTDFILENL